MYGTIWMNAIVFTICRTCIKDFRWIMGWASKKFCFWYRIGTRRVTRGLGFEWAVCMKWNSTRSARDIWEIQWHLKKRRSGRFGALLVWLWVGVLVYKVSFCKANWFEGAFVFFCFIFKILLFRPRVFLICFTSMFRNLRTNFFCQGGLCGELRSVCVMNWMEKSWNKWGICNTENVVFSDPPYPYNQYGEFDFYRSV